MYMTEGIPGDRRAIICPVGKIGVILSNGEVLVPYLKEYKKGKIFSKTYSEIYYPRYVSIQEYTQGIEGKLFWRTLLSIDIDEWKALVWEDKKEYFNIGKQVQVKEPVVDDEYYEIDLKDRLQGHTALDLENFEYELPLSNTDEDSDVVNFVVDDE